MSGIGRFHNGIHSRLFPGFIGYDNLQLDLGQNLRIDLLASDDTDAAFLRPAAHDLVYRDSRDLCRRERVQNILHLFFSDNRFYFSHIISLHISKEYPLIETVEGRISGFPVFCSVQTDFFIVFFRSEFRKQTDDSRADQRSGDGYCDGHQNSRNLNRKEMEISKDQTIPASHWIDGAVGEDTCGDTSPDTADSMAAESVQRLIITELFL